MSTSAAYVLEMRGNSASCRELAGVCEGKEGEGDGSGAIILLISVRRETSVSLELGESWLFFLHKYLLWRHMYCY